MSYDPFRGIFHEGDEPPPDPNAHAELLRLSEWGHRPITWLWDRMIPRRKVTLLVGEHRCRLCTSTPVCRLSPFAARNERRDARRFGRSTYEQTAELFAEPIERMGIGVQLPTAFCQRPEPGRAIRRPSVRGVTAAGMRGCPTS